MTMGEVLSRIRANAERLEAKVTKKMAAEADHFRGKHGLDSYPGGASPVANEGSGKKAPK